MGGFVGKETVIHESNIVWLKDLSEFPWVRETRIDFCQRQGISKSRLAQLTDEHQILVGYADLAEDAPPEFTEAGHNYYFRRVFKINRGDYENYEEGQYPVEAVVSSIIQPKVLGISPKRKPQIAVRLPFPLFARLNQHLQKSDQSLTETVTAAITQYLDEGKGVSLEQRVRDLELRVASLESQ